MLCNVNGRVRPLSMATLNMATLGDSGVRECDQKVLFILQIDKKKSNILQYLVNGNGISGFVTLRNTTKRQNWSALPCT